MNIRADQGKTSAYTATQMLSDMLHYIRSYRWAFLWGTLLSITGSAIWLLIPWAIGEIITFSADYVQGEPATPAWQYLGIIGGVALYYYLSTEIARYTLYMVAEKAAVDLQEEVLHHTIELNLQWHEAENSGNKLKKISRGGTSLNHLIRMYTDMGIDAVVSLLGVLIVFFALSWKLNLILLVFFIVHYTLSYYLTRMAIHQSERVNQEEEDFHGLQFEILNSITTVKTLGIAPELMRFINRITRQLLKELGMRIFYFRSRLAVLGLNQQLFRLLIIGFSVWQVIEGNFEVGLIAQIFFYFSKIEIAAQRFSSIYHRWIMTKIDLMGVREILQTVPEIEQEGSIDFPVNWQLMEVKNLKFQYDSQEILSGIDLTIHRGEKIGLVGASGEGKSTLIRILQKMYDNYEGEISFDDISLQEIKRDTYAPQLGVVLQEAELFNFSLKDNITLGKSLTEEEENWLKVAIEGANLTTVIEEQEEGWDAKVGEKGVRLSGGERQRLGIARALFRRPQLLFLDEATAHLDGTAERKIQEALEKTWEGITVMVIAHRLSTLMNMDRIVVLEKGKIVEMGSFEELLKKGGRFHEMWEQQLVG